MKKIVLLLFALISFQLFSQIPTTGLVGYWPFSGNANDGSGNGNNGAVNGASLTSDRFGNTNSAYSFNGTSNKIVCGTGNMSVTNKVTVSFWIKTSAGGDLPCMVTKYSSSQDGGYVVRMRAQGSASMEGRDGNNVFIQSGNNTTSLYDGLWHHIAGIVNIGDWQIWVDGVFISSYQTGHTYVDLTTSVSLVFGALSEPASGNWRYFAGIIDDIRIYNVALNSTQIQALFNENNCSLPVPTAQDQSRCGSGTLTLTASGGTAYRWYQTATGGSPVATGSSFTTPVLTQTTTYYVANYTSSCESTRQPVNAIINPVPVVNLGPDITINSGSSTTLNAGSGNYTYLWSTGETSQTITVCTQGTYSVTVASSAGCSADGSVNVIVCSLSIPTAEDQSRCGSGTLTLTASGGTAYRWYQTATGGAPVATGSSFTTPVLTQTTTYYVANYTSSCESTRQPVNAIINPVPVVNLGPDITINSGSSTTLNAGSGNYTYLWSTGATSQTIIASTPGTYSVTVTSDAGCSAEGSVNVYVLVPESPWTCVNTGNNHTILVPSNIDISINGNFISSGDYIGVFYDLQGTLACGGYLLWNGSTNALTAWGTDISSGVNNGFDTGEEFIWKIWDASENIEYFAVATYNTTGFPNGGYYITNGMSSLLSLSMIPDSPDWSYNLTGSNHTILISNAIPITADGSPIHSGDYIGVFFDSTGVLKCGGYAKWLGATTAIAAWGTDPTIGIYSGFAANELFKWKIWKSTNNVVYNAVATYNPSFPNTCYYAANGMSVLTSLIAFNLQGQAISLPSGWSIFSTYINPVNQSIVNIVSQLSNLIMLKDGDGNVYWPQYGVNSIGNISTGKGYNVKMSQPQFLYISGSIITPESTPVNIPQGWSIIGYLRQSPAPIVTMLGSISGAVKLVKSGGGQVYWPQYGVNNIVNMNPGEGYQINMISQSTLIYPPN
jgi:hypothetical protein